MSADVETEVGNHLDRSDLDGAATTLLRGYGREILGYLFAVLRDGERADEAFAQFSEDLWNGIRAFRRESSGRTWAYTIAWHAALRVIEDPYRRRGQHLATSQWSQLAEDIRASTAHHRKTSVKDRLARLREQLDPDEQTLLILRLDRDLSWREVAEVLGVGEPALRKRFERVKTKLADLARADGLLPGS